MHIALYEPDIPQNTGTILRTCACLGLKAHIIEPAGFPVTDRAFRRAGMDYLDQVSITRHGSFAAFEAWRRAGGLTLVLLTTAADRVYSDHTFGNGRFCCSAARAPGCPKRCNRPPNDPCPFRSPRATLSDIAPPSPVAGEAFANGGWGVILLPKEKGRMERPINPQTPRYGLRAPKNSRVRGGKPVHWPCETRGFWAP